MKQILLLVALIYSSTIDAQQVLIPYKVGNQFGLSNEEGKLIVPATYDHIEWLEGGWFETKKMIELKDTLETEPHHYFIRNETVKSTGLILQGKVILKDEPFDDYEIVANKCIITKTEVRNTKLTKEQFKKYNVRGKFYCIFNLAGKNLYPELFRRIQKVDTTGTSSRNKGCARYVLFWGRDLKEKEHLFVFDADKQMISDWLLKDAVKLKPTYEGRGDRDIIFDFTDKDYQPQKGIIDYSTGKFKLKILAPAVKKNEPGHSYGNGTGNGDIRVREELVSDIRMDDIAVPMEEKIISSGPPTTPKFATYHTLLKDSLFLITGPKTKEYVSLPAGSKVLANQEISSRVFYGPVMYKNGPNFGIIREGVPTGLIYDSLIYFGNHFIATQTINGKKLTGIINAEGNPVIPFEYDSVYAGIRLHDVKDMSPTTQSSYRFTLKEADSKYNYSKPYPYSRQFNGNMTVFKNGLCGVLNISGDFLIPLEYEFIAQNNISYTRPRLDDFIVIKKKGRYGMTWLRYDKETKKTKMTGTIEPIFEFIPCFYIDNYFQRKGLRLIGLYDEHFKNKGYANTTGFTYFKD